MKKEAEPGGTLPRAGRVVVGVDGSPGSLVALSWALSKASLRGVEMQAVGVWEYPGGMGGLGDDVMPLDDADPQHTMAAVMATAIAAATASMLSDEALPPVTSSDIQGNPATELQHAVGGGDLLVVGSRGHGEVAEMLLGSVSQHVISRACCPVVVVPKLVHLKERVQ